VAKEAENKENNVLAKAAADEADKYANQASALLNQVKSTLTTINQRA
jgi:hypothetical protein